MTASDKKRNIVIFAGAGASRALPDTKFPTTIEFFNLLPQSVRENAYFSFIENYIRSSRGADVIDIEEILLELQTLLAFLKSANDKKTIIGQAVASKLVSYINPGWNFGHLQGGGAELAKALQNLQGKINEQVYNLYSKEPTDNELDETWNALLKQLIESYNVDIFTTNYDLVIESSIQSVSTETAMYRYLGATGRYQKHLDLKQWQESVNRSDGLLTKLHGSLNWKLHDEQILLGDWAFTGDHAKQVIIYPGFKGQSDAVFFDPFHDYLTRSLARADDLLVIGFAFRDEIINQIFRSSLNPKSSITVMDTNKDLKVPLKGSVIRKDGFNVRTISSFARRIAQERLM